MNPAADFLFRCNPEPGWIYDRETLEFLAVNEAAVARYGYSEDEFLGMTIADIRPKEDVAQLLKFNEEHSSGPHDAGRWRHRRKNGEIIIVEVRAFPVSFLGRKAELVAARDVTDMDRFEKAKAERLRKDCETAALFSMAGRAARFGGWRVDLLTNELLWSEETAAIHGVSHAPQTIRDALEYYVPEHRPIIESAFRACIKDGVPYDHVLQIVTGKGRKIWVRAIGEVERDAENRITGVWGAFQDVDDLLAAKARVQATEKRLADTLNSISEGFMVLDQQWRLTFLNVAGAESIMRADGDLIGAIIWDAFPEARGSRFERKYRQAIKTGATVTFEEFYPPLARWFEVRAHPTPDGLAVYFRDVTDRRRSLEALRLSEERFQLVAAVTNDVIWDLDLLDGSVWFSEHMALRFGHESDASLSEGFWEKRIHPEDRERVLARLQAVLDGDGVEWSDEYRFLKADGSVAHVIDRARIIRDAAGTGVRMVGSMTDVTARVEMEAQLREALKLETVGQLTGGVAHDFNNLLTVIIGTAEALAERLGDDTEGAMLAEMTAAAAQRGAELTTRLLAFARQQPLEPRAVDVANLITDFGPILRRTLSEDIELEVFRPEGLWAATVDPGQLETAVLNLVINARDAMPLGGRLAIKTTNAVLDETDVLSSEDVSPGQYVVVAVSDTGSGMAPDVVANAFQPFFTTKVGKGSGLGLSMVYGLIKQSRGHVTIDSTLGEGTTISLYLPRAHTECVAPRASTKPAPVLLSGDERILVVEDDPMVREHVTRLLRGLGYAVTEAFDGPQALDRLKRGETFDLLFTDVVMPGGMNGPDLALAAQALCPDLRILFTSGYTENTLVHDGRLDLGVQLLSKPYRKRDLAERIRRMLDA